MSENPSDLEARVGRLETLVESLVREVRDSRASDYGQRGQPDRGPASAAAGAADRPPRSAGGPDTHRQPGPRATAPPPLPSPSPRPSLAEHMAGQGERWLGRIGIGFVVLAVAFLLKLGFDRGWITPLFRLILGGGIGAALLVIGLRVEPATRRLGQALLGGSVAVFYLVGWAGFALYDLVPFVIAFSIMTTTTVLAIALAERQDSAFLAVIGVSGGLSTPFLLNTGSNNVIALAAYVTVVLLGGGAVHYHKGWRSLLATLNLGGGLVLVAVSVGLDGRSPLIPLVAVAVFWLVAGLVPTLRLALGAASEEDTSWELLDRPIRRVALYWATGMTAVLTAGMFEFNGLPFALIWFGLAAILAAGAAEYRSRSAVAGPPAEAAGLAALVGLWIWPGDESSILFVAIASVMLLLLHQRNAPGRTDVVAHVSFALASVIFLAESAGSELDGFLGLRDGSFSRLGAVVMAGLASLGLAHRLQSLYRGLAYAALLIWSLSTLDPLSNGAALVSIAWTIQGAVTLLVAMKRRSQPLQFVGLGTIVLVAAKMLIVDLADMDPVWRILLFMGFGVGLLGLAWLSNRPGAETSRD